MITDLLQPTVDQVCDEFGIPQTDLTELEEGIIGLPWLKIVAKKGKRVRVDQHWAKMTIGKGQIPVLLYKNGKSDWQVRMQVDIDSGRYATLTVVTISLVDFLCWFEERLTYEIQVEQFLIEEARQIAQNQTFIHSIKGITKQ